MRWILIISSLLALSCNKPNAPDCFQKAGSDSTEIRLEAAEIHTIELTDQIDLVLVPSEERKVLVTAPENLLPEIITELNNGRLFIENQNTCNFVRKFDRTITVEVHGDVSSVENRGTGNIGSRDSIRLPAFHLENRDASGIIDLTFASEGSVSISDHTGVAEVFLHGYAEEVLLFNQGLGVLDATDLEAAFALTNNSSINRLRLRVSEYLYAEINKSGITEYYGAPNTIDLILNGTGSLIDLD